MSTYTILIADDEPLFTKVVSRDLESLNARILCAASGEQALEMIRSHEPEVVLCDRHMPGLSGEELLARVTREHPATAVVMISGTFNVTNVVWALKNGAFDYLEKPYASAEFICSVIARAAETARLRRRNIALESAITPGDSYSGIVGSSPAMREVFHLLDKVAPTDTTVLISGESGTGKEVTARALHERSLRSKKAFVAVNCASFNDNLLESELFGHVKGAFTGADAARKGLFEAASGGTIFLDEIGHVSMTVQTRLLRVLQEQEVRRVGSNEATKVDVRVIAATNANLQEAVNAGTFRLDLLYRLNVFEVKLPALRERKEDLPALANLFLRRYAAKMNKRVTGFSPAALHAMQEHRWPGNVRELDNVVQRGVLLAASDLVDASDLPLNAPQGTNRTPSPKSSRLHLVTQAQDNQVPFAELKREYMESFEREYLQTLLDRVRGNLSQAARLSGIDRTNLRRRLKELGLREPAGAAAAQDDAEPTHPAVSS